MTKPSSPQSPPSKALNVSLWVVQVLLALMFGLVGVIKLTAEPPPDMPVSLFRFIGVAEVAGALGMLLPGLLRIKTWLTPLAAVGFVVIMMLAFGHHAIRSEWTSLPMNVVLGALAAFVAWGRFKRAPLPGR